MTSSVSQNSINIFPETKSFSRIPRIIDVPDLVDIQKESFVWFQDGGLTELFNEISPIEDNQGNNPRFSLRFVGHDFEKPKFSEDECREQENVCNCRARNKCRRSCPRRG